MNPILILFMLQVLTTVLGVLQSDFAEITDHPWMVLVSSSAAPGRQCNGVIVAPHYVLTSNLCASYAQESGWMIRSGSNTPDWNGSEHELDKIIWYENLNDILPTYALIRVKQPFIYGQNRKPISLFEEDLNLNISKTANITGWGRLSNHDKISHELRVLSVDLLNEQECRGYNDTKRGICVSKINSEGKLFKIGELFVPLVINGSLTGFGITHINNKLDHKFAIFKKTAPFTSWIRDNTDNRVYYSDLLANIVAGYHLDKLPQLLAMKLCYVGVRVWQQGLVEIPAVVPPVSEDGRSDFAEITDHPWMVFVGTSPHTGRQCNGVIVAPHYVLTSSYCASYTQQLGWIIRSGSDTLDWNGSKHQLDKIIRHSNQDEMEKLPFFALIRVKQPFISGTIRKSIPLIGEDWNISHSKIANVTGWEQLSTHDENSNKLRVLSVNLLNEQECGGYNDTRRGICVSKTDSEGKLIRIRRVYVPLVINGSLAGLGIMHVNSKLDREFAIFKRVSPFIKWIRDNTDQQIYYSDLLTDTWADYHMDDLLVLFGMKLCYVAARLGQQYLNEMPQFNLPVYGELRSDFAEITDHPWMVLVGTFAFSGLQCNGVIVAPHYVLTSSYCASYAQRSGWIIRSGSNTPDWNGSKHQLDKIIRYSSQDGREKLPFFALIRVKQPFMYGKKRKPISLVEEDSNLSNSKIANVTGWGRLSARDKISNKLRVLSVNLLNEQECSEYNDTKRGICVSKTDSEGKLVKIGGISVPLVINGSLVGLGIMHVHDGTVGEFTIFRRTASFIKWIRDNAENRIDYSDLVVDTRSNNHMNELMITLTLRSFGRLEKKRPVAHRRKWARQEYLKFDYGQSGPAAKFIEETVHLSHIPETPRYHGPSL
ncbi:hypothetical protein QAD02_017912 [Eretmocerus hayati]|uniref:Uncharacterized protein n=1 Tax=Eretmocerus hayati TaxID=131215 RepID=A0ACC2PEW3_9HYME|nr:hypothetical protein QAD02_017912 [Eretmocerus hayati]